MRVARRAGRRLAARVRAARALLARPGAILSRAQLEDKLYGWDEEVESNTVEVHIHALRKKLGADVIRNVRGVGWMIGQVRNERSGAMKSIRRELLVWLLGRLALAIVAAAFGTYFRARQEANALFDYQLRRWRRR